MRMRKTTILVFSFVALGIFGCSESPTPCQCANHQICVQDKCVDKPTSQTACTYDSECPVGNYCLNSTCHIGCLNNTHCQNNQICQNGTCIQNNIPECVVNNDCPIGKICDLGICRQGCLQDSECAPAEYCHSGTCKPKPGCQSDTDCPNGQECKAGQCVTITVQPECTSNSDCTKDQSCILGKCATTGEQTDCFADVDCSAGELCIKQTCVKSSGKLGEPCNPTFSSCDGNSLLKCENHVIVKSEDCSLSGKICDSVTQFDTKNTACLKDCSASNLKEGDIVLSNDTACKEAGFIHYAVCSKSDTGKVVALDTFTTEMSFCQSQSNGYALAFTCEGNTLKYDTCTSCTAGGSCASVSIVDKLQVGDKCDPDTFKERCEHGKPIVCIDNLVMEEDDCLMYDHYYCDTFYKAGYNFATCVTRCENGETTGYYDYCDEDAILFLQCTAGDSGKVAAFEYWYTSVCTDDKTRAYCEGKNGRESTCRECKMINDEEALCYN